MNNLSFGFGLNLFYEDMNKLWAFWWERVFADLRFFEYSHVTACGTDIFWKIKTSKNIHWKDTWISFHFILVWVIFIQICESYGCLSENWFLTISIGVTGSDLGLKNYIWMGKINGLQIWKLDSEMDNLKSVLDYFNFYCERYLMPYAGLPVLFLVYDRENGSWYKDHNL